MWGNMAGLTNYPVNGGASDYMLATHNIYAITALLGTSDVFSQDFYIQDASVLKAVCDQNYPWFVFTMTQLIPELNIIHTDTQTGTKGASLYFTVANLGLSDSNDATIKLTVNNTLYKDVEV